jgi:hypothetical protein
VRTRAAANRTSESPSEIEITLPEGQKLTIRSLDPGSVVEVASWRGTGKPDEAAIRMLFGASGPDTEPNDVIASGSREAPESVKGDGANEIAHVSTVDSVVTRHHKRLERTMEENRIRRRAARRIVGTSVSMLVTAGVLVGLHLSGIAEFHRPDSGITTGLGPASSSIAVVNNNVDIVSSSTVLVLRGEESVLAGVAEVGDGELVVFDETGQFTVSRDDVQGRVLFVLPFLGYLGG